MFKRWIGSLVIAAAMPCVAVGQDTPPPPQGEGQERPGRRQRGQGGPGMGGGMLGMPVERLKEELGLTDEQVKQVEGLAAEMREKGQAAREAMRNGDFEGARAQFQALGEQMRTKLDEVLTPEQREKAAAMRQRQERFGRGGEGGPGARGERGGRGRGPEQARARLREQALEALALTEEEKAVVLPLLDATLETRSLMQEEGERRRQAFLEKARASTDPEGLTKLLAEFRASREQDKGTVKQAMDQLREVLTVEQEAKLVGLGVLD